MVTVGAEDALTGPQRAILADVRRDGVRRYNGRARRSVEALQRAGLVVVDFDLRSVFGGRYVEVFTLTPKD